MPIFVVYQIEDGTKVSETRSAAALAEPDILAARGYAVAERPDEEAGGIWNKATLRFDPRPVERREITAYDFVLRFTPAEVLAMRASADQTVKYFLELLDIAAASGVMVDLDGARTAAGLAAAVAAGHLALDRTAEILA